MFGRHKTFRILRHVLRDLCQSRRSYVPGADGAFYGSCTSNMRSNISRTLAYPKCRGEQTWLCLSQDETSKKSRHAIAESPPVRQSHISSPDRALRGSSSGHTRGCTGSSLSQLECHGEHSKEAGCLEPGIEDIEALHDTRLQVLPFSVVSRTKPRQSSPW